MGADGLSMPIDRRQLEDWLSRAMTPVEPSARFIRRLRGGLVTYRGSGLLLEWKIIAAVVTLILLTAASLGLTLRILLGLLGLFGIIQRSRRRRSTSPTA